MNDPYFDLGVAATEMKTLASERHMQLADMMQGIASLSFPPGLKRILKVDGHDFQVQFSHDQLSPNKFVKHLSFSRLDRVPPDDNCVKRIKEAFFGDGDVLQMPSLHGPRVIQMGQIVAG